MFLQSAASELFLARVPEHKPHNVAHADLKSNMLLMGMLED